MRRRLPWALLVLSLALNLTFLVGFAWVKWSPGHRAERIMDELDLKPPQRTAFRQLIETVRESGKEMREANRPLIEQTWQELGKPKPDQAVLAEGFDKAIANRRAYQRRVMQALTGFVAKLDPEQRTAFLDIVKKRQARFSRHSWRGVMP